MAGENREALLPGEDREALLPWENRRRSFLRKIQVLLPSCQTPNILGRSTVLDHAAFHPHHLGASTCSTGTCNVGGNGITQPLGR